MEIANSCCRPTVVSNFGDFLRQPATVMVGMFPPLDLSAPQGAASFLGRIMLQRKPMRVYWYQQRGEADHGDLQPSLYRCERAHR